MMIDVIFRVTASSHESREFTIEGAATGRINDNCASEETRQKQSIWYRRLMSRLAHNILLNPRMSLMTILQ